MKRRSIPTRVGKTWMARSTSVKPSVHPHACGENLASLIPFGTMSGPSPRVWGKPQWRARGGRRERSIPTRVGKTRCYGATAALDPVHPHACGENAVGILRPLHQHGPSPRVWGKRRDRALQRAGQRSIPTRVGKTFSRSRCCVTNPVHPHACGENCAFSPPLHAGAGPSPRVWGKLQQIAPLRPYGRSIPTRVGKT